MTNIQHIYFEFNLINTYIIYINYKINKHLYYSIDFSNKHLQNIYIYKESIIFLEIK